MRTINVIFYILLSGLIFSCNKEQKDQILNYDLVFVPSMNSEKVDFQKYFQINDSLDLKLSTFRFYISQAKLNEVKIDYSLMNYKNKEFNLLRFSSDHKLSNQFEFYLGVDSLNNHGDPTVFDNNHPLNVMIANDMYWGWDPGYIFLKIEGIILNKNTNETRELSWHISKDEFYRMYNLSLNSWVKVSENTFTTNIPINLNKVFINQNSFVNIWEKHICHSGPEDKKTVESILSNFGTAFPN